SKISNVCSGEHEFFLCVRIKISGVKLIYRLDHFLNLIPEAHGTFRVFGAAHQAQNVRSEMIDHLSRPLASIRGRSLAAYKQHFTCRPAQYTAPLLSARAVLRDKVFHSRFLVGWEQAWRASRIA